MDAKRSAAVAIFERLLVALGEDVAEIRVTGRSGAKLKMIVKLLNSNQRVDRWREPIVNCLKELAMPLSRKQLAYKLNKGDPRGPFGQAIVTMIKEGILIDDESRMLSLAESVGGAS